MRATPCFALLFSILGTWLMTHSASAATLFVKASAAGADSGTSWTDAYTSLQSALDVAQAGDEIWVAIGTYTPTAMTNPPNLRSATFRLLNGLAVYGGFRGLPGDEGINNITTRPPDPDPATPNPATDSILSGDVIGDDGPNFANYGNNVFNVVNAGSVDGSAIIDGFVITAGNASAGAIRGGGISGAVAATPSVRNCALLNNKAQIEGGGVYGSPNLYNCLFAGNTAGVGGGAYLFSSTVSRCQFEANSATSSVRGGGGVWVDGIGTRIVNCVFSRNQALMDGSAAGISGDTQLVNCVVSMHAGSAVRLLEWSSVVNCAFFKNDVAISAGSPCSSGTGPCCDADVRISNSIIWAVNIALVRTQGACVTFTNSCLEGWDGALGGSGNFGDDPRFVDADGPDNQPGTPDDDLRLLSISPCIDRGDNSAIPVGVTTDLDGSPRIYDFLGAPGTGVDIGAYEFQASSPDVCNGTLCPGDINGDHSINALDIQTLVDTLLSGAECP